MIVTPHYWNAAGLPNGNTGCFVSEGTLQSTAGVWVRAALPFHRNQGGLPEMIIPNSARQVRLDRISGVNPRF